MFVHGVFVVLNIFRCFWWH